MAYYAFDKILSPYMMAGKFSVADGTNVLYGVVQTSSNKIDISKYIQALFTSSDLTPSEGGNIVKTVTVTDSAGTATEYTVYWGKTTPFTSDIEDLNDAGVEDTAECESSAKITLVWVDITGHWQTWSFLSGDDSDEAEEKESTVENYITDSTMKRDLSSGKTVTMKRQLCAPLQTKNQRTLLRTIMWSPLVFWKKSTSTYIPVSVTSASNIGSKTIDNYEVEIEFSFESQQM